MSKDVDPRECSVAGTLELVGERWSLLAVRELAYGVRRFDSIARNTGASRDILAARLRKLEAAGIVRREKYSDRPPRFEYHLTPAGHELGDVLLTLMAWGDRHLHPADPPVTFQHSCGRPVEPVVACRHCGAPAREGLHSATGRGTRAP